MLSSEQNDERSVATGDDSSNADYYIIAFIRVNSCSFVANKKIPAIKPGSGTFRMKYYASAPPSLSVFLSGLRPGIGRLDLLLR